jgi:hypothetical protein
MKEDDELPLEDVVLPFEDVEQKQVKLSDHICPFAKNTTKGVQYCDNEVCKFEQLMRGGNYISMGHGCYCSIQTYRDKVGERR